MPLKLLVISPYDAMSHQYWRYRLVAVLEGELNAEVRVVTLPPRFFAWRFRGNSLTLSHDPALDGPYDLIIATSMTDLSSLRGLKPSLAQVPAILYFHENQFAYPDKHPERQTERQITSIYSALAAERIVFNSRFNQSTFLAGAGRLLGKMPDGVPEGLISSLKARASVISVPVDEQMEEAVAPRTEPPSIVWNHRWEHDKGLIELAAIVDELVASEMSFKLHLIGQPFRQVPGVIAKIKDRLGDRLGQFGFVEDRSDYLRLLSSAKLVLSTARHEFQGIAVLEAVRAGCIPVVPDDLAYKEFIPDAYRYESIPAAVELIRQLLPAAQVAPRLSPELAPETVAASWCQLVRSVLA